MTTSPLGAATRRQSRHALRRLFTVMLLCAGCAAVLVPFGQAWT